MITDRDITKLKGVFATKDEVKNIVQEETTPLKENIQEILTIADGIAKKLDEQEYLALKQSDERQNRQLKQLADHTGIQLID